MKPKVAAKLPRADKKPSEDDGLPVSRAETVARVKGAVLAALQPLGHAARLAWLKRELAGRPPTGALLTEAVVRDAFVCQYALGPFFGLPRRQATPLAARCLSVLRRLATANRRNVRHLRDAHVAIGNYWSQQSEDRRALASYRCALAGETDPDRRGLALLNVAKLHVAAGRYHEAMRTVTAIDLDRLTRADLREALRLLRVRSLLVLGADDSATRLLAETRGSAYTNPRVDLERRYLGFVARWRAAEAEALSKRADDFLAWLKERGDEATSAFYELELLILRRVAQPEKVRSRARLLARARYLAQKSGATDLYEAAKALDPVVWDKRARPAQLEALEDIMVELGDSSHHLLFQTLALLLARRFGQRLQHEAAAAMLAAFREQRRRLRASFPDGALRRLDAEGNRTGELAAKLEAALPAKVRGKAAAAGLWL